MSNQLKTQPYTQHCAVFVHEQEIPLPNCCPVTGNPQAGSTLTLRYQPLDRVLEVKSLSEYVASYQGGRDDIRDMEGMISQIVQDCADAVGTGVQFNAVLWIDAGDAGAVRLQRMLPSGEAHPKPQLTVAENLGGTKP